MQWSDATRAQTPRTLRQFGLLCLAVFGGWAMWRLAQGETGVLTVGLGATGAALGILGLAAPSTLGPVFTAWMIAAFPIGWTISRVLLAALFYVMFTPVATAFRLMGRDALSLRRQSRTSYWIPKSSGDSASYFRQS